MFGYIKPNLPYLYLKDDTLYKALYCGICKGIGKSCGQIPRFTLTYDMAFMSCIMHNILGIDVKITKQRCVAHQIKKRPVAKVDELTLKLAKINVILAIFKIKDDIIDEKTGHIKNLLFSGAYKKACKDNQAVVDIVNNRYKELRQKENQNCTSIDIVSDPFSLMLKEISREILTDKASENTDMLFYNIGKWIYLIDALDDYDKDIKKSNYNPFISAYNAKSAVELLEKNGSEISFIFNSIFSAIVENLSQIKMKFNTDLITNILLRGLPNSTNLVVTKIKDKEVSRRKNDK